MIEARFNPRTREGATHAKIMSNESTDKLDLPQAPVPKKTLYEIVMSEDVKTHITQFVEGMMTPERCISIFWNCCQKTPLLQQCAPITLISSLKNLLLMRCEPDGIHGYLVPFWVNDKRTGNSILTCAPVPSARGLMRMARSNGVTNLNIGIVREGEPFSWRLDDGKFTMGHIPGWGDNEDPIRGFYCTWTDKDSYLHGERMSLKAVEEIKGRSKSKNKKGEIVGPWVTDFGQMGLKTVIKRASKQWDLPLVIQAAMQAADDQEFEGNMRNVTPEKTDGPAEGETPWNNAPAPEAFQNDQPEALPEPKPEGQDDLIPGLKMPAPKETATVNMEDY